MDDATHERVCELATKIRSKSSTLNKTVSCHILNESVSFKNLEDVRAFIIRESNEGAKLTDYIATIGSDLILSVKGGEPPVPSKEDAARTTNKKRKREETEWSSELIDLVGKAVDRAGKHNTMSEDELKQARLVLTRVVTSLRGAGNEDLVQSFGIFKKQLRPSDPSQTVLVAVRLNAGVPVSVAALKRAMGKCWADGVITCQDTALGIGSVDLPLSPEGTTAKAHGNLPMLLVSPVLATSVPSISNSSSLASTVSTQS